MGFKKPIFRLLLIVSLLIITGCSNNVLLNEERDRILNYEFKVSDTKNIDKTLSKQRYSYSTDIYKKFAAVVTYKSKDASMKQYLINEDGTVDLTIPKDSNFIISLPANRIIAYTWNIKNSIDTELISFENRSWIHIPMPKSSRNTEGDNYDRQNFYFKPLKSGSQKIVMRYEHQTEQREESFEITFNITIE